MTEVVEGLEGLVQALESIDLHNNGKRRRFKRDINKVKGPSGEPHPFGNRQYRRSKEGKAEIQKMLWGLRNGETLREEFHDHPMNVTIPENYVHTHPELEGADFAIPPVEEV